VLAPRKNETLDVVTSKEGLKLVFHCLFGRAYRLRCDHQTAVKNAPDIFTSNVLLLLARFL